MAPSIRGFTFENFLGQAAHHLRRFNGNPNQHFHIYLKKWEWDTNPRLTENLLKVLRKWATPEKDP
jgi:transposase